MREWFKSQQVVVMQPASQIQENFTPGASISTNN